MPEKGQAYHTKNRAEIKPVRIFEELTIDHNKSVIKLGQSWESYRTNNFVASYRQLKRERAAMRAQMRRMNQLLRLLEEKPSVIEEKKREKSGSQKMEKKTFDREEKERQRGQNPASVTPTAG